METMKLIGLAVLLFGYGFAFGWEVAERWILSRGLTISERRTRSHPPSRDIIAPKFRVAWRNPRMPHQKRSR